MRGTHAHYMVQAAMEAPQRDTREARPTNSPTLPWVCASCRSAHGNPGRSLFVLGCCLGAWRVRGQGPTPGKSARGALVLQQGPCGRMAARGRKSKKKGDVQVATCGPSGGLVLIASLSVRQAHIRCRVTVISQSACAMVESVSFDSNSRAEATFAP